MESREEDTGSGSINQIEDVVERKLWAAEKVTIPAGSAKLVKVRTKNNWRVAGFGSPYRWKNRKEGGSLTIG